MTSPIYNVINWDLIKVSVYFYQKFSVTKVVVLLPDDSSSKNE